MPCLHLWNLGWLLAICMIARGQERYQAVRDDAFPTGTAYTRYHTRDDLGRRITFYLSGDQNQPLPLVVSILGSGAYSSFIQRNGKILDAHRTQREVFGSRAHVLIVEKPGISFLEQHSNPGTATEGSLEFRREHTLERWGEAISAALRAAYGLACVDRSKVLLVGHSEGALAVAWVAGKNPEVTHVASLAGSGPTQLFDFLERARNGILYDSLPKEPARQVAQLLADVVAIMADPNNPDKFWFGHPYRRWSSFMRTSAVEELSKTAARVFIALGTGEGPTAVQGFDVLYASLLSRGKDVCARLINGADHAFQFKGQPQRDAYKGIYEQVRDWFFVGNCAARPSF
jgi:pimeloyl-ACP methyl ester carboxylesterase